MDRDLPGQGAVPAASDAPGLAPVPALPVIEDVLQPQAGETLDRLAGSWRIFQLKAGHRFSADDVLTAWTAARVRPAVQRFLDLGCGIGSVGLLTLWRADQRAAAHGVPNLARMLGVEVQELSLALARRTVAFNGLLGRVELRHGDLRDAVLLQDVEPFELITGSPPYFPVALATTSAHPQRAGARMELRGTVFDYCATAARHLAPDGRFVLVHAAADPRPEQAIQAAGLCLLQRQDVVFRSDQPPLIALFVCGWQGERRDLPPFVIRDGEGAWTQAYLEMRAEMGTIVHNRSLRGT